MADLLATYRAARAAFRTDPSAPNAQAVTLARQTYLTYRRLNRS